ncbi:MAG: uroporphyrinogen-III synthase [Thiotrichaceae bacterium]
MYILEGYYVDDHIIYRFDSFQSYHRMNFTTSSLSGLQILITRPQHQTAHLNQLITQAGATTLLLPVLAIEPLPVQMDLTQLSNYQWLIFTSTNAVEYGLPALPLPSIVNIASIGKKTELSLQQHLPQRVIITAPPPHNSESLLTLPAFQRVVANKIMIVKGEGGRELLGEILRQRGAIVDTLAVYRRTQPIQDVTWLAAAGKIDAIIVTSNESLSNLFKILSDFSWLSHTPLILMSERMVETARQLGSTATLWIAPEASDAGLLQAVFNFANKIKS